MRKLCKMHIQAMHELPPTQIEFRRRRRRRRRRKPQQLPGTFWPPVAELAASYNDLMRL